MTPLKSQGEIERHPIEAAHPAEHRVGHPRRARRSHRRRAGCASASIGVRVSETNPETRIATEIVNREFAEEAPDHARP